MTARYLQKEAHEGLWARRVALFFLQLLVLTVLLHRFGSLGTPAAMNLLAVSIIGLFAAIAIAVFCLVRIWFGGQLGTRQAVAGIAVALIGLALPLWYLSHFFLLPSLTDIETSPKDPLEFKQLPALRPADANRIEDPDEVDADAQQTAYPDIQPMVLERSASEVFDMVKEAVKRLGWEIVAADPPTDTGPGLIEATDRTLIMGFTDDVAIGISGDDAHAQIDVRSVSRYGLHDFGANADRIRGLFTEINATLEKGEKTIIEQMAKPGAKVAKTLTVRKRVKGKPRVRRPPPAEEAPQSRPFLFR
jgi:uncharacterized protein (DUF1499 family)